MPEAPTVALPIVAPSQALGSAPPQGCQEARLIRQQLTPRPMTSQSCRSLGRKVSALGLACQELTTPAVLDWVCFPVGRKRMLNLANC